jgi:hypothetical protein
MMKILQPLSPMTCMCFCALQLLTKFSSLYFTSPDGKEVVDIDDEESEPHQNSSGPGLHKKNAKFPQKRGASVRKKRAPTPAAESDNEDAYVDATLLPVLFEV